MDIVSGYWLPIDISYSFLFRHFEKNSRGTNIGFSLKLKNNRKTIVMFNCRADSDSLWEEYKVELNNVLDIQLSKSWLGHTLEQN